MPHTSNLLNLKVDQLFKEYSAHDVRKIQEEIELESEKKKEELRMLVGEKYRDLLKAADTIAEMKETSQGIVQRISSVIDLCETLKGKYVVGFKEADRFDNKMSSRSNKEEIAQMFEIKLFLLIAEEIWCDIDEKNFLSASEKYLLSAHIGYNLQIGDAFTKFTILKQQMNAADNLRLFIINAVQQELHTTDLDSKVAYESLCALLLLQMSSLKNLFHFFLNARFETLENLLKANDGKTVKEKLQSAVVSVYHTLSTVAQCFCEQPEKEGLIGTYVIQVSNENAASIYEKLRVKTNFLTKYLSPVIKSFKPNGLDSLIDLEKSYLSSHIEDWLIKVQKLLGCEVPTLLNLLVNLHSVRGIRDKINTLSRPSAWTRVKDAFQHINIEMSTALILNSVNQRAVQIIDASFENILIKLNNSLSASEHELKECDPPSQSEKDVRWFVWKESDIESVFLKTRAFTPRIMTICNILNEDLHLLIEDVKNFDDDTNKENIISNHINKSCFRIVQSFCDSCKKDAVGSKEESIVLRGRLLQALQTQSPNLEKCIRQSDQRDGASWRQVVNTLVGSSVSVWREWKDAMLKPKIQSLIKEKLDPEVSLHYFLASKPACELIVIEEEVDENKSVTSELLVPTQPSFNLQETLFQLCLLLNCVAVHTLPRIIHNEIIELVGQVLFSHYEQLLKADTIYPSQAWQLLLDIRFLSLLLLSQDDDKLAQNLIQRLEEKIDPFDLNVCYPYLHNNIKKSANRLQGTFGLLINYSEKLAVLNSLKVTGTPNCNQQEEPNALAMISSGTSWFPLLPVATEHSSKKGSAYSSGKSTRQKESRKDHSNSNTITTTTASTTTTTDFVKSAGAFFGWA